MSRPFAPLQAIPLLAVVFVFAKTGPTAPNRPTGPNSRSAKDTKKSRDPGQGVNFYSIAREKELGKQLSEAFEAKAKTLDDSLVTNYLNRLADKLTANTSIQFPVVIQVAISDVPDSVVFPGGHIFMNSGLILGQPGEPALAAVLAHDVAHIALRTTTRLLTKAEITQIAFTAGAPDRTTLSASRTSSSGMELALPLQFLRFSRDAEYEADSYGVQFLHTAGYDPEEYVEMLEQTAKQVPPDREVFSPHPLVGKRIKLIRKEITKLPPLPSGPSHSSPEFEAVLARLRDARAR